jgi:hypothetical protein
MQIYHHLWYYDVQKKTILRKNTLVSSTRIHKICMDKDDNIVVAFSIVMPFFRALQQKVKVISVLILSFTKAKKNSKEVLFI